MVNNYLKEFLNKSKDPIHPPLGSILEFHNQPQEAYKYPHPHFMHKRRIREKKKWKKRIRKMKMEKLNPNPWLR